MSTFKEINANDIVTRRSFIDSVVDVVQEDISGSTSRRQYQLFVTGGVGPGVTSSLFQTVYDQDFTLSTANAVLDVTFGLYQSSSIVIGHKAGEDANGKALFASGTMMMREKMYMYQQHAQKLLGNADEEFIAPFGSTTATDVIDAALFLDFKRLFGRDQIKRETFVVGMYGTASIELDQPNIAQGDEQKVSGFAIYTDIGASSNKTMTFGGQVSDIVDASNTANTVGLLFNDAGIAVFDMEKIMYGTQRISGAFDAMKSGPTVGNGDVGDGRMLISASFIPDFIVSASMDDFIDHVCSTRFGSGSISAMTFQNITNINSSLLFARLTADEFNYSSNPTFVDTEDRIVVIDEGQEETQQSFIMISGVGFYDSNDNLLAMGKLSRPVEKSPERDLTLTVRLDY